MGGKDGRGGDGRGGGGGGGGGLGGIVGGKKETMLKRNKWAGAGPPPERVWCGCCSGKKETATRDYGKLSNKFTPPVAEDGSQEDRGSGDCGAKQENYIPIDARDLMTLLVREIPSVDDRNLFLTFCQQVGVLLIHVFGGKVDGLTGYRGWWLVVGVLV
jgi:hypothetical protein